MVVLLLLPVFVAVTAPETVSAFVELNVTPLFPEVSLRVSDAIELAGDTSRVITSPVAIMTVSPPNVCPGYDEHAVPTAFQEPAVLQFPVLATLDVKVHAKNGAIGSAKFVSVACSVWALVSVVTPKNSAIESIKA